jgi:hypothetical protein
MPHTLIRLLSPLLIVAMAGCATSQTDSVGSAVTAPLSDLNVLQTPIPEVLELAQTSPYGLPHDRGCVALTREIRQLDEALGPDLDAPTTEGNRGLMERGSDLAEVEAVGALRRTTESLIPFRSWVRKLSGADRYARHLAAAINAGVVRRAFLKGLRVGQRCEGGGR